MNTAAIDAEARPQQQDNRHRLTQRQLLDLSSDIDAQPDWRTTANTAVRIMTAIGLRRRLWRNCVNAVNR